MSTWDEIKSDAGKVASKVAVKTGEIADAAAARVKLQAYKLRLCEEYEKLGRLTYRAAKTGEEQDVGEVMGRIDRLNRACERIRTELAAKKAPKEDAPEAETKA